MEFKDYYKIMGVAPEAGADEIKRAYRKLARKYHPDVSDDPNAEDRFKEVGEAYEVLKDPAKREEYDQLRKGGWRGGQEFRPPPGWSSSRGDGAGFDFSGLAAAADSAPRTPAASAISSRRCSAAAGDSVARTRAPTSGPGLKSISKPPTPAAPGGSASSGPSVRPTARCSARSAAWTSGFRPA